jgi:threonine synthase
MLWKGVNELTKMGLAKDEEFQLTGVQATGCSPIVEAFERGLSTVREVPITQTLAIDLKVTLPPLGNTALDAIRSSHGSALAVSDDEILEATRLLAKTEGIFAEPVSASTVAALKKMVQAKDIDPQEEVICVITGAGLKDPSATSRLLDRRRKVRFLVKRREERVEPVVIGETKTVILRLLDKGETYGYEIWRQLGQRGIKVRIPSIYQHLSELEVLELVERSKTLVVAGKPERRCYILTAKGRETLALLDRFRPV